MFWWIIATLCAYYVKGLCGFANTLVFTSILSFSTDNINISPVDWILGYPANAVMVAKERKHLNYRIWLPLALLVLAGSIPGVFILKNTDVWIIKIICGCVLVGIGIELLCRELIARSSKQSKVLMFIVGLASGLMCGLYGIGALIGAYVSRVAKNDHEFKANICIVFLVENTFRGILYIIGGIVNFEILKQALILIPIAAIGMLLGILTSKKVNEKIAKIIVIVMIIASGISLIITNLI